MGQREIDALTEVIRRRCLYRGAGEQAPVEVEACERELAAALGREFALLSNSGTSALVLALRAAGVGAGDEVVVPGYGWLTDVGAVLHTGATPVLAAVDDALGLDPASLESAITERTRAIMPVHPCGRACDLSAIERVAAAHGVPVIDDVCQGYAATRGGKPLGAGTHASVFSFQAFKLISCGEGGALATDDEQLHRAAVRAHDAGLDRFGHALATRTSAPMGIGLNLRMSELAAAVLRCQLERVPALLGTQRETASLLERAMQPLVEERCLTPIASRPDTEPNYTFVLWSVAEPSLGRRLAQTLSAAGVPLTVAADDLTHALPGWLGWLRSSALPHRVVDMELGIERLARTLVLEVPSKLSATAWERLRQIVERAALESRSS
jgi:8-amino-3,8-dideoxy-alpha-D-manno-octulosonate transaminase